MANNTMIMFKRGLQANLPAVGQDGAFYLTTDSHRLYAGIGEAIVDLNQYIKTVDTLADLDNVAVLKGDFVYISSGNIFAVCTNPENSGANRFTQVNPDHDTYLVSGSSEVKATSDGIAVTLSLTMNNSATPIQIPFTIKSADIATANNVAVDLAVSGAENKAVVKTTGDGAKQTPTDINIVGAGATTVSVAGQTITVNTAKSVDQTLSASGNKLTLAGGNSNQSNIITLTGDSSIGVTGNSDEIKVEHTKYAGTNNESAQAELASGTSTFKVIDTVELENGHIKSYTTKEYKMPEDHNTTYSIADLPAESANKVGFVLNGSDNSTQTVTFDDDLYFKIKTGEDGASNEFTTYGIQEALDVYTRSQVDAKLNGVNAMVYKGTVGGSGATVSTLPTENVKIGDTYMVATIGDYDGAIRDVGDLFIATGNEVNGIITSNLEWTHVPAGDDTDTQFRLDVANNVITLQNTTADQPNGTVTLVEGNKIKVATSDRKITIAHEAIATTSNASNPTAVNPNHNESFNVIDAITTSDGHITGYTVKKVTLPQDANTTNSIFKDNVSVDANIATITSTLTDTANNPVVTNHKVASESLRITATNTDQVNIDFVWGSF